jgi:hypothetical protein
VRWEATLLGNTQQHHEIASDGRITYLLDASLAGTVAVGLVAHSELLQFQRLPSTNTPCLIAVGDWAAVILVMFQWHSVYE